MKKVSTDGNSFRVRRNSSFQKTLKRDCSNNVFEALSIPLEEAKTVRLDLHKKTEIPILKLTKMSPNLRTKLLSVEGSLHKAMAT